MASKKGATSAHTIKAKGGCLQHNRRTQVAVNVDPSRTHLNTAWEHDRIKNLASTRSLIRKAEKLYTEKTKQKCQASFAPLKETCVVCKESTTLEDAMKMARKVEKATGVVCLGVWIHKDEGHAKSRFNPDEPYQCNYHIHFLWDCQNPTTGKAIPLKRQDFRDMQDIAAESLGMERGTPAEQTGRKHIESMTFKVQQLSKEVKELKKERTGLLAKIQDAWQWKGRAKQAEADLEAEKVRLTDEINKREDIINKLWKSLGNEKEKVESAEKEKAAIRKENIELHSDSVRYQTEIETLQDKNKKLMEKIKAMDVLQERAVQTLIDFGKSRRTFVHNELRAAINNYIAAVNPKATVEHRKLFAQALVIDCIHAVNHDELLKLEAAAHEIANEGNELSRSRGR